ncbi:Putative glucose-6-phosphate 1-epimerase [Linum grandiflorum]
MGHHSTVMEITKDCNGIDQVLLRNSHGASAKVSLHGAQVVSWRNELGEELLFTSTKPIVKQTKAIMGGIPICFPQFGNCGSLEQQGFARNKLWRIDEDPPPLHSHDSCCKSFVDLVFRSSEEDLKCWPHITGDLMLASRIRNVNGKAFSFSFGYHTHLSVSDISEVRIEGLETLNYLDNLCHREQYTEQGDAITFESELDRVYLAAPNVVAILDHERKRTYVVRKEGLPDFAVWNPWEKKSKAMPNFGDEEYRKMVCVDGAAIEKPITLKPGEEWTGRIQISVVPSSFCNL